jgi:hypothetical protein
MPDFEREKAPIIESKAAFEQTLHNETLILDGSKAICTSESLGIPRSTSSTEVSVIGKIGIPIDKDIDKYAAILKFTNSEGRAAFALWGLSENSEGHLNVVPSTKPVRIDDLILGRGAEKGDKSILPMAKLWGEGQHYGPDTSRRHVMLSIENGSPVITDQSANGTRIEAGGIVEEVPDHAHEHTVYANHMARRENLLDNEGRFSGREVINRDTPDVDGKVDIRSWGPGAEAIVIDSEKYPEQYQRMRSQFNNELSKMAKSNEKPTESQVAEAILRTVSGMMTYDGEYVDDIAKKMSDEGKRVRKVELSLYLEEGKGICRHMALAAAWLGKEARRAGLFNGVPTAEVNEKLTGTGGAHEWMRFTSNDTGDVYIVDPAQNYHGTLQESLERRVRGGENIWEYFRPGEKAVYKARLDAKRAYASSVDENGMIVMPDWMK